uniref:Spt6 acidic N-terminal domain-containing protein n=1 Tax=Lactuca sativa TaxID=4236 RepID=A0A9R1UFW1_LACSA|nr:hypothetical protein LSAT_V11C900478540 [Lactuca sativa]
MDCCKKVCMRGFTGLVRCGHTWINEVDDIHKDEHDAEEEDRVDSDDERQKKKKRKKRETEKNYVLDEDDYELLQDNNITGFRLLGRMKFNILPLKMRKERPTDKGISWLVNFVLHLCHVSGASLLLNNKQKNYGKDVISEESTGPPPIDEMSIEEEISDSFLIEVSKEDGCLLESANGSPIFVLRKSELVPINGIDSGKIKITPKQTQTEQIDDGIAEDVEESKRTKEVLGSAMTDVVIDAMIAEAARREKYANLSSWLPRREVAPQSAEENSRFPARGRTLGATQTGTVSNNAFPNSTLQTRLLESGNRPVYPSTEEATARNDRRQGGINTDATAAVSVVSDEEIQKLVAMGFDKVIFSEHVNYC